MLDKKTDAVLNLLVEKAGDGYSVLNKEQLLAEIPSKYNLDIQALLNILNFLKEDEYIDVKYQDKDEICISCTVKAESYMEGEKDMTQKAKISNGQVGLLFFGVFLAAFIGSIIATLIGRLLF